MIKDIYYEELFSVKDKNGAWGSKRIGVTVHTCPYDDKKILDDKEVFTNSLNDAKQLVREAIMSEKGIEKGRQVWVDKAIIEDSMKNIDEQLRRINGIERHYQ